MSLDWFPRLAFSLWAYGGFQKDSFGTREREKGASAKKSIVVPDRNDSKEILTPTFFVGDLDSAPVEVEVLPDMLSLIRARLFERLFAANGGFTICSAPFMQF